MIIFSRLSIGAKLYFGFLMFVLGAVFGSFCNAWAWRIVNHESILKGRSHCPECGHTLAPKDLVPIFSYMFLKGKCRYCGAEISSRYVLNEFIGGALFLSLLLAKGISFELLRLAILGCLLLVASLVDIDIMELPDGLMIAGAVISLIRFLEGAKWTDLVLGLIPALALLIIVLIMDRILKKETMGGGDIKLMAVLGLNFGPLGAVLILILACIFGLVAAKESKKKKDQPFPFAPMLAAAAWVCAIVGNVIIELYLAFF